MNSLQIGRYERGQAQPHSDSLHRLAEALDTTTDYLLEGATDELAVDRLSDRDLLRQFQDIEKLPENRKQIVKEMLGSFIKGEKLAELAAG